MSKKSELSGLQSVRSSFGSKTIPSLPISSSSSLLDVPPVYSSLMPPYLLKIQESNPIKSLFGPLLVFPAGALPRTSSSEHITLEKPKINENSMAQFRAVKGWENVFLPRSMDEFQGVFFTALDNNNVSILRLLNKHSLIRDSLVNEVTKYWLIKKLPSLKNSTDILKLLIEEFKLDLRPVTDLLGQNFLHTAVTSGNVELVNLLLKYGFNINKPDNSGLTVLHKAFLNGNLPIIKLLLDNKASLSIPDEQGNTPVHFFYILKNYFDVISISDKELLNIPVLNLKANISKFKALQSVIAPKLFEAIPEINKVFLQAARTDALKAFLLLKNKQGFSVLELLTKSQNPASLKNILDKINLMDAVAPAISVHKQFIESAGFTFTTSFGVLGKMSLYKAFISKDARACEEHLENARNNFKRSITSDKLSHEEHLKTLSLLFTISGVFNSSKDKKQLEELDYIIKLSAKDKRFIKILVETYNHKAKIFVDNANFLESINYSKLAIESSKSITSHEWANRSKFIAYYNLGLAYKALDKLDKANELIPNDQDVIIAKSHVYHKNKDLKNLLKTLNQISDSALQQSKMFEYFHTYTTEEMLQILDISGLTPEKIAAIIESLGLKPLEIPISSGEPKNDMEAVLLAKSNLTATLSYFQKAVTNSITSGFADNIIMSKISSVLSIFISSQKIPEGIDYLRTIYKIYPPLQESHDYLELKYKEFCLYEIAQDRENADRVLGDFNSKSESYKYSKYFLNANLFRIYTIINNKDYKALSSYIEYVELADPKKAKALLKLTKRLVVLEKAAKKDSLDISDEESEAQDDQSESDSLDSALIPMDSFDPKAFHKYCQLQKKILFQQAGTEILGGTTKKFGLLKWEFIMKATLILSTGKKNIIAQ